MARRTEGHKGRIVVDINPSAILDWGTVVTAVFILAGCVFCVLTIWERWQRGRAEESLEDFLARHSAGTWPPPPGPQPGRHDAE